ncbi:MAG: rhomboid family intramembrane serine protease, partial [Xanthomonadales bacterium]|nr:rhomboid family intramembrane serine protease [Xanthomonadales bacterium]
MLILPLHRRMTLANAPMVTLTLILLNCLVYFALQSGDDRVLGQALDYYAQSDLGRTEFPAYQDWLLEHADNEDSDLRLQSMQTAPAR